MQESQFGAAVEEARDHQIAGILLAGGATPWIGRRVEELQEFASRIPLLMQSTKKADEFSVCVMLPDLPSAVGKSMSGLKLSLNERSVTQLKCSNSDLRQPSPVLDVGSGPE